MMRVMQARLGDTPSDSDKIIWGGICLAFFFLERGGEFWGGKHALKMSNIMMWEGVGKRWKFSTKRPKSVSVKWDSDKTSTEAEVNLFASGDKEGMCPVDAALWILKGRRGLLAKGKKLSDKASSGSSRATALAWIQDAARATGVPEEKLKYYKLHSLRVGGTTVLAAAGKDELIIRLHGRWRSNSNRRYAHRTPGTFIGVSAMMMAHEKTEKEAWGGGDGDPITW